jgi:ComF family protein
MAAGLHSSVCTVLWSAAANGLVRTFLAPPCAGCDTVLERPFAGPVCDACWRAVVRITPPLCAICGDALPTGNDTGFPDLKKPGVLICARCAASPPRFTMARSAGRYDGPLRNVIHVFKYGRRRPLAAPIARLMTAAGAEVLTGADAVVPVPLHPWRALRRGFNQADDLAVHLDLPVWRALRRSRHGPPQASLAASQRGRNVGGAFAFGPMFGLLNPWWTRRLRGRTVVLVDDVMTTGATLDACSVVLLAAGVRSVRALTAARAVAAQPARRHVRHHLATAPR